MVTGFLAILAQARLRVAVAARHRRAISEPELSDRKRPVRARMGLRLALGLWLGTIGDPGASQAAKLASADYTAKIHRRDVVVQFYQLERIRGPFRFYVATAGVPEAPGCGDCESTGIDARWVVPSDQVYQRWTGKYVETRFPQSAVGGLSRFYFTAVTVTPGEEHLAAAGECPR